MYAVKPYKKSEKSTGIFLNTDFGREKNPLTWNTYIYQQKKFSKSVVPELYTPQLNILSSVKCKNKLF